MRQSPTTALAGSTSTRRRRRRPLRPPPSLLPSLLLLVLQSTAPPAHSSGFLSLPRSRNLVAYEDKVYYPLTSNDPLPEDCPACLDRGGSLARCGIVNPGNPGIGSYRERNYDYPQNALGGVMPVNTQQTYARGEIIEVEVTLTSHRGGHFEFKSCPVSGTTESPTQECFDDHPLAFVSDELYGANPDLDRPERAYVAPKSIPIRVNSEKVGFGNAMAFLYRFKLPEDLTGELVLMQWHYVASSGSCVHEGYDEYDWPKHWTSSSDVHGGSGWDVKANDAGAGLPRCALPEDGDGAPEQFWNCAEISITEAPPPPPEQRPASYRPQPKTVIGYYAGWQWYDRNKLAEPINMDFSKVTRVNFAYFQVDANGNIWGTDTWADPNVLYGPYDWIPPKGARKYCSWITQYTKDCKTHRYEEGLIGRAHAAGAEVYPSLGGRSPSDAFRALAANGEARARFARKCAEMVEDYDFDGLDVDWEYTGHRDHSGTTVDTENYNLLLRDIRLKLDELGQRTGKFYGLTAALPCGTKNIASIDIPTIGQYLTEFNLMTYDFFGAWSPTTGPNAPLYEQGRGDDDVRGFSVNGCVIDWIKGGAPHSAINVGLPFYGRSFLKAKGLDEDHWGNDRNTWYQDDGSPRYFNILEKLPDLVSVRDESTRTQYAYEDSTMGGLVSYDDEQAICDKTEYGQDQDLNGFIIWELSGDLMPDLSTPLLDAVNRKLADPALDCKTLAYIPTSISISDSLPTPAPSTTAPTAPLYCPIGATGPRQHDRCTGYYHCVYGTPKYPVIPCPKGTMFDEKTTLCLHATSVTCSETTGMPSQAPSPSPTQRTTTGAPAFTKFVLLGAKEQSEPYPSITSSAVPAAPSDSVEFETTAQARPGPEDSMVASTATLQGSNDAVCPDDYTGVLPWNDCSEFFYCIRGDPLLPTFRCEDGTLFDANSSSCADASRVGCVPSAPPLAATTAKPTKKKASKPKPKSPSNPAKQRPTLGPLMSSSAPSLPSPLTAMPTSNEPRNDPSRIPTKAPIAQPDLDLKGPGASSIRDHENDDSSREPLAVNVKLNSTLQIESFVQNGSSSNDTQMSLALDSKPVPPPSESRGKVHDEGGGLYFWSSSISHDGSSTEHGNAPFIPSPEELNLVRPFVTIEIILNNSPGDVGWQLLSLDGTINVAKPTGAYGAMKPGDIVYEGVSLRLREDSTTPSSDGGARELRWTILNVRGEGLDGGNWKMYSGSPIKGNLLVEGGEFEYVDTVGLAVAEDGVVSLLDVDIPSEQSAAYSAPTSLRDEGADDGSDEAVESHWFDPVFDPARERESSQMEDANGTSKLMPALISSAVIAVVIGLVFLVLAHRRKTLSARRDGATYEADDDVSSFDEGSWNFERGKPPPDEAFDDCYDVAERHRVNDFYSADRDDHGVDPPDSYNGYAAEQRHADDFYAADRADGVDPPDDYFETTRQRPANNFYAADYRADGIDPPDSYDGYEARPHATDSRGVTTPRLSYEGIGADDARTDLNVSDITNPTAFGDENRRVATPSFSYDDGGADRDRTDLYFEETADRSIFADGNGIYDSDDIDELFEETMADSGRAEDSDIYSILEQLEEDMQRLREIT